MQREIRELPSHSSRSTSVVLKDVVSSFYGLIKSEIHLAKTEATQNAKLVARHSLATLIAGALIFFGVECLLAFAVIGLGIALNDRYWLSALIVGLVISAIGAFVAMRSVNKIKEEAALPLATDNLQHDRVLVEGKLTEIRNQVNENFRRAA